MMGFKTILCEELNTLIKNAVAEENYDVASILESEMVRRLHMPYTLDDKELYDVYAFALAKGHNFVTEMCEEVMAERQLPMPGKETA